MRRVRIRWVLITCSAALLLAAVWVAWQAWQVNSDLTDAVDAVDDLRAAAESGDTASMKEALGRLSEASESADDRTSGPTWSLLIHLPVVGDDAHGVRTISSVVHGIAIDGAEPLVSVSKDLAAMAPRDSEVSVGALRALQPAVSEAAAAMARADSDLAEENPQDFLVRLRNPYRELVSTVRDAHRALSSAEVALEVMPTMLGADGSRSFLMVFQNNAEVRATGGLPGAVSVVSAKSGRLTMTRQVAAATAFPGTQRPVLPLSEAEKVLYGDLVGRFFVDANFTPDFPRVAELMRARWQQVYPESVDGVVAVDPVALSYVLGVSGPIEVDGLTLTSENLVEELLHNVYLRLSDPADQDEFFQRVAQLAFEKISTGGDKPQDLLRALARGADEGRIYVHSFDPSEQALLSGHRVAGELEMAPTERPQVDVTFNDSTGSKMSYYLDYDVDVRSRSCIDGVQSYTGSVRLQSTAPADAASLPASITGGGALAADPGLQYVNVVVFAPSGGEISDLRLDGTKIEAGSVMQGTRPADYFAVQLEPGQVVQLGWRMKSGPRQSGPTDVDVTPGLTAGDFSFSEPSACP